jgi:UDP-sulfoquinovose synthase
MKILILGSDGYLGWPTTMHFANLGHEVFAIDNLSKRKIESEYGIEPINSVKFFQDRVKIWNQNQKNQINYLVTDLLNYKTLCEILSEFRPETIVHYAEQPSAPYSMADREKAVYTQHNNVIGNLNLLFALKKYCPDSHLIKLGTMGEYGTPNIDIEEGWLNIKHNGREDRVLYPKKPGSFYHLSKVHDSANIEFACRIWGIRCTDLNQGFVYGVSTKEIELDFENLSTAFHYDSIFGTIINRFVTQMTLQKPMSVYGKGTQKRAFLNIQDTINCVQIASENPAKKGEFRVFNQFTEFCSLNEMAEKIKNFGEKNKLNPQISHITNPRIEEEDHYYHPKNTSLISLGLKPILFDGTEIEKIYKVAERYKDKINLETLDPKNRIKWNLG